MLWSKAINKMFGTCASRFYPGRKATASAGFCRGAAVWMATVAIKAHDDGYVCPHCGGTADPAEVDSRVMSEGRTATGLPAGIYVSTECVCAKCGGGWTIRARPDTSECVVEYNAPRNELSGIVRI